MGSSLLINAGDSGAIVLQALINAGEFFTGVIPSKNFFDGYLNDKTKIENYFSSRSTYKDSYYLGKSIGDILGAGVGVGISATEIFKMLTSSATLVLV